MTPSPTPPTNPANPVPPTPPSPTGQPTALGELLKNKYVAGVLALVIAAATTIQTMVLTGQAHFPAWLVTTAGIILGVGALLGLYSPGARGGSGAAAIVVLVATAALLHASPAHALDLHAGPSLPLLQLTPGDKHPVAVAPGAGFTVGVDLFPGKLGNRDVHVLTLAGDVFGSLTSSEAAVAGALSIALHVAFFELFTVGVGAKLLTGDRVGFLDGPASYRQSWFLMLGLDGGLVNFLQLGHLGQAPAPVEQPCDGDHPCEGAEPTGAAR